ncbi:AsnC family transcriptional regulator [Streptomyces bambusae]|uniref:Lrp/AsnC family transcriptional regulator n=1 Tax=Streptomyces bambusae TaxID=1550616 RepID=UPI001CFF6812|nr:Lrp/AsnC family transcriptional regulator [Streptomyces bambusae]MCB5170097.1 AsnC family transcriptional regulator [Streptomyces bambusae]
MYSSVLDEFDRALVQALVIDGRAPFSRLAEVLGFTDQKVVRRYRRLRGDGLVRVIGVPYGRRVGLFESWVRVQCAPDAALPVAEALARRPDTAWVSLGSGGTEIHCITKARSREDRDDLLLEKLPRTRRVTGISAHTLLRMFAGGPHWVGADLLSAGQQARLRAGRPSFAPDAARPPVPHVLDAAERAMLAVLGRDGRAGYPELAAAAGLSETTARRRLAQLREGGALYFDVEVIPRQLGFHTVATLLLTVPPARLAAVGQALAGHPEVPFAAAVTGAANLLAVAVCRDTDALYAYLTERIGGVEGVRQVETIPTLRNLKRAGMLVEDDRLVDPPAVP